QPRPQPDAPDLRPGQCQRTAGGGGRTRRSTGGGGEREEAAVAWAEAATVAPRDLQVWFSNSQVQSKCSSGRAIAVRRTASLPLAYPGHLSFLRIQLRAPAARIAPESFKNHSPKKTEGAGNAG